MGHTGKYAGAFLDLLIMVVIAGIAVLVFFKIVHFLFEKKYKGGKAINFLYFENFLRVVVVIIAVFWVISVSEVTAPLGKMLFQGTALIGAIAGLAAQPVISDMICGLMMSTLKPFELGDRIELEDGTAGIVKNITVRHVVLQLLDTAEMIIPNSKLNGMKITNMSRQKTRRSFILSVNVSFDTDIRKALEVVKKAVMDSPYTVPGKERVEEGKDGKIEQQYGPVYFMAYGESALELKTTIYYEVTSPTEVVKSDVNTRVKEALETNGIEIPFQYVNVVMKPEV